VKPQCPFVGFQEDLEVSLFQFIPTSLQPRLFY
jgi:hypothetical protein